MLNFLRPGFARLFTPVVQALARTPVTPNMITVIGTVGVSASPLARLKGSSGPWGAFLDSTMDRVGDAAVFGGITIWFIRNPSDHVLAVVSLFCLACGMWVSYVKARAQSLGLKCDVGLIERPERMLIGLTSIGLSGLGVPYILPIGMWALAAGSLYTFYQRMRAVYQEAKSEGG